MDHKSLCMEEYLSIRIRKFLPKRSQAVLRNLLPETMYALILYSENCFARSLPCVAYVQTLKSSSECIMDEISPVFYAKRIRMSTERHVRQMQPIFNIFCRFFWPITLLYIFISVLLIIFCWSDVSQTGWFIVLTCFKTTISLFFWFIKIMCYDLTCWPSFIWTNTEFKGNFQIPHTNGGDIWNLTRDYHFVRV